jgi:hypothetical protein
MVPKKDGSKRLCVDFRRLNDVTIKNAYPIPFISSIFDQLRDAYYVSSLDLEKGYWQVELDEASKLLTAFTIPQKVLFEFTVMPFRVKSLE